MFFYYFNFRTLLGNKVLLVSSGKVAVNIEISLLRYMATLGLPSKHLLRI